MPISELERKWTGMDFNIAAEEMRRLQKEPTDEEKLQLYGMYKQAVHGDIPPEDIYERPTEDELAIRKYNAWAVRKVMGLYLSSLFCERLSPALGFWERVSAMENSHEYIALTTTQGRVYACRRCEPLAAGCKLDCFDLRTMAWTTVASLPICPQVPSLVSHGSEIFIIGGSREDSRRVMVFREGTNACSVEYSPKAGELLGIETTALASKLH
ncbi:hypothetical protein Y032_0238g3288 [Ancylostoma ceylanicum]|uniref:ACB domain-containing protein n=1 Tax=Ancylostoma ceylanicum TaxID=53326 RepID=A0A016SF31_9BILA|nr:hypothetical protein Y032_0238g3288 [Ancylostoma ceylanicum]